MGETMISTGNPEDDSLIKKVYDIGQGHIFKFWDELSEEQRKGLLADAKDIDFELLKKLVEKHVLDKSEEDEKMELEPSPVITVPKTPEEKEKARKAKEIGEKAIRDGKVGIFVVAGGQGSRLGYEGPKGCFQISPVKNKPIFQLHAEQILALQKRHNVILPWYIMTSRDNDQQTKDFFEKNNYFGLQKENVMFFKQAMIPAVTTEGKLILAGKDKIFKNPDGHGGSISALKKSGAIDDMKKRGIEYISYFQVDNVLIKIADPVFIGYHIMENAQMSSKIVEKSGPKEKVGVVGYMNGKLSVIEYSCLPDEIAEQKDENGKLRFWAGSIAIHAINVDFVEKLNTAEFSLPYYKAFKAISYVNEKGEVVKPDEPNAIKFEKFIFDSLKETTNSVTMEVVREHEFAPVKNKEGVDSVETAKELMINYHASWLKGAGVEVPEKDGKAAAKIEISPLYALDAEELKQKVGKDLKINEGDDVYLGE